MNARTAEFKPVEPRYAQARGFDIIEPRVVPHGLPPGFVASLAGTTFPVVWLTTT
ncbi:MAG: hypothetical protein AB7L13_08575 [Acidimicrobiia bacterium]